MENRKYNLSFDELENKIEVNIEGLVFEIKQINDKSYYNNIDDTDSNRIENEIEKIIGKGSIEKINNLRKEKGKDEMDIGVELNLLLKLIEFYTNATAENVTQTLNNTADNVNNKINDIKNLNANREQRRSYNRNNRNNYYRGNRRRY